MREQWAKDFAKRAADHWTRERVAGLIGDKKLPILPNEAPLLLRALGLLHRDALMPPAEVRKFRQINHMVAVLGPSLRELAAKFDPVRIVDIGCGRSYLTAAVGHYFQRVLDQAVQIIGIDRNADVIAESERRVELAGLADVVRYRAADADSVDLRQVWSEVFGAPRQPDMLISLHACDTATDDGIAQGVRAGCHVIAVAPCCQAELAAGWRRRTTPNTDFGYQSDGYQSDAGADEPFSPLWSMPHLRRATAASITDAMRVLLLSASGYATTALEFVPAHGTPKNTLIRGIRRSAPSDAAYQEYLRLRDATGGVGIKLERLLALRSSSAKL
ncbi:MAG: methyltransferase [Myxococcota bacterium]